MLDPQVGTGYEENLNVIESIILAVAKDSAAASVRRLARLNKCASSCIRQSNESMTSFFERFVLPAQAYLNYTSADQSFAANQNLALMMITNANLSAETFTNVMTSLVFSTKNKERATPSVQITSARLPAIMSVLQKYIFGGCE